MSAPETLSPAVAAVLREAGTWKSHAAYGISDGKGARIARVESPQLAAAIVLAVNTWAQAREALRAVVEEPRMWTLPEVQLKARAALAAMEGRGDGNG